MSTVALCSRLRWRRAWLRHIDAEACVINSGLSRSPYVHLHVAGGKPAQVCVCVADKAEMVFGRISCMAMVPVAHMCDRLSVTC